MCLSVPGQIRDSSLEWGLRFATVDFGGVRVRVCIETLGDVQPGTWVLVHAGVALQTLDEVSALQTLRDLGVREPDEGER